VSFPGGLPFACPSFYDAGGLIHPPVHPKGFAMSRFSFCLLAWVICALTCFGAGCNGSTPSAPGTSGDGHDHGHDHAHDHAHAGPHGGQIIEIGEEEYHAEMTHADDG